MNNLDQTLLVQAMNRAGEEWDRKYKPKLIWDEEKLSD